LLGDAVQRLRDSFGNERAAWGEVNRFRIGDVDLAGEGASGTYGCFRVMRFDAVPGTTHRVAGHLESRDRLAGFGDAWVLLVDFSEPINAWSILAYGQTTDLQSIHSRDQIRLFATRSLRPARYDENDVAAHTIRTYRP
jgi:acyl-homoserine-lactone acylase